MGVTASGPPFDLPAKNSVQTCKCGWMLAGQCRMDERCGLNQGVPEYKEEYGEFSADEWDNYEAREQEDCLRYEALLEDAKRHTLEVSGVKLHTPYEFLEEPGVDLNKVCREVVEDLVKEKNEKKTLRDLLGEGVWDHYKEYPDGSSEYVGKSRPKWDSNGLPVFTGWENTEPVTYLGAKESPEQVGGTHYAEMSVQPWDAMRAWMSPEEYAGYHVGTVVGYLSRHKKKGGLQDILKAKHHLEELVRYFEEDEEYPW